MTEILITCAKCSTVMDRVDVGGVEVDLCSSCGGIWLDKNELEKLAAQWPLDDLKDLQDRGRRQVPPSSSKVHFSCPACTGSLRAYPIESSKLPAGEVLIDICTECKGLWLDKGELDVAIAVEALLRALST